VAPAKILATFAKAHAKLQLKGGLVEGEVVDKLKVTQLAALPSREELLTKLVFVLNSPITGLVRVLNGTLQGLPNVLNRIKEKKA